MVSWKSSLAFIVVFFVIANLIYLDLRLLTTKDTVNEIADSTQAPSPTPTTLDVPVCSAQCEKEVAKAVEEAKDLTEVGIGGGSSIPETRVVQTNSSIKEFYIPFGSGTTKSQQWEDIHGTDTTIDTSNYGSIKEIVFEASAQVPTGNGRVFIQLYNVTNKHPAWNSEVSTESNTSVLLKTSNVVLDPGNNTYRIQLKSSLGAPALLDFARVKIVIH